jgi:hypothetical protein
MTLMKTMIYHFTEYHYAECYYAKFQVLFIVMLSVVMLSVVILSVIAPFSNHLIEPAEFFLFPFSGFWLQFVWTWHFTILLSR